MIHFDTRKLFSGILASALLLLCGLSLWTPALAEDEFFMFNPGFEPADPGDPINPANSANPLNPLNRLINGVNEGVDVFGTTTAIDMTQVLNIPEIDAEWSIEAFDEHELGQRGNVEHEDDGGGAPRRSNPNRQGAQNPRNLKRSEDEKKQHGMVSAYESSRLLLGRTPQRITTKLCQVDIASGSAALVIERDDLVTIFDLHDEHPAGVTVSIAGKSLVLHPGDELVLSSNSNANFADIHGASMARVGVRNVKTISKGIGKAYQAEFSIPKCLASNAHFRKALFSSDASERVFANKIMKTAVIVNIVTSSHGQYKLVQRKEARLPTRTE